MRDLNKLVSAVAISVLLGIQGIAQVKKNEIRSQPDFVGTWILEKIESPGYPDIKEFENYILIVSRVGETLKFQRNYALRGEPHAFEINLFTDKRGETNQIPDGKGKTYERTSKTHVKKNVVYSDYEYRRSIDGKWQSFRGEEKFYLSKDGEKLTFQSVQTFPSYAAFRGLDFRTAFIFRKKD